jgi:hypothetical protein
LPPDTLPFTALAGVSFVLQEVLPVADLPRARFWADAGAWNAIAIQTAAGASARVFIRPPEGMRERSLGRARS